MSDKSHYNLKEMMRVAQDLRAGSHSSRSGKKLRRRSAQGGKSSVTRNVIYTVLTLLMIAGVIITTWMMSRHQEGQAIMPGLEVPSLETN
jgi:hypothetical protein